MENLFPRTGFMGPAEIVTAKIQVTRIVLPTKKCRSNVEAMYTFSLDANRFFVLYLSNRDISNTSGQKSKMQS